jgi:hypothetical protein
MRKAKGKRYEATDHALKLILRKLTKGYHDGYDANAVLEVSITNNWLDAFFKEDSPRRKKVYRPMTKEEIDASRFTHL